MNKVLVVHDGKRERELLLVERLVVGRDPMCDFSHDDALLSRRHAEFFNDGDDVKVRDLGSRNGLFVNGARAAERTLHPGDIVTVGPLRVRYITSNAPVSMRPEELESGATKVVPAPRTRPAAVVATPMVAASPPAEDVSDADEMVDEEEVTRVVPASDLSGAVGVVPGDELDGAEATMLVSAASVPQERSGPGSSPRASTLAVNAASTLLIAPPAPSRPAPDLGLRPSVPLRPPLPTSAPPVVAEPVVIHASALTGFVFVLLAALASVVFVASAAPLIMWRGADAQAPGLANLLRWPVLPIIIAMATTYVIATLVNRRFLDALMALQQDADTGHDAASPGGYPQG